MNRALVKTPALLGALILLIGAGFHLTALGVVSQSVDVLEPEFFKRALPAMWMMPALHWMFIAFLSIGLSRYSSKACAAILMAFGLWVFIDGLVTYMHVDGFIGAYLLSLAGGLLFISGFILRRDLRTTNITDKA